MKTTLFTGVSAVVLGLATCANATIYNFAVILDGPSESPANASPGFGSGTVQIDDTLHLLSLNCSFSGLTGTTTQSHIHAATTNPFAGTAGVATTTPSFAGFPSGVTSGTYAAILDMTQASTWNASYITANGGTTAGAEAAFTTAALAGKAYWNIHTSTFGGGEIRGFLPEPSSIAMASLAGGYALARRKRKAK